MARHSRHEMAARRRPAAVIVGMMGAGKTRLGKEMSQMLGIGFADADQQIEEAIGMSIPKYFARHGEAAFREVERRTVAETLGSFDGIYALGGGAPMTPAVREALHDYAEHGGRVIYLLADPAEAMERARRGGGRPMLDGDADARWMALYEQRDPVYRQVANVIVRTHGMTPKAAARKMIEMTNEGIVHVDGAGIEPYDVRIGEGALNHLPDVLGAGPVRVALIHTQSVQRHSDRARAILRKAGYQVSDIVIPDAEAGKTVQVADGIWQRLGNEGFTRSDAIVGLGGGACTDLAGFVAATWMRGVRYVNCPTSLLAMVDASTGGKTGVNTPQGKNLVGSFYTPAGVLADLRTLTSLPNDIFIEGLGEVAKSGFIRDPEILTILEDHADELRAFIATVMIIGLFWVWSGVLPALDRFDSITLWAVSGSGPDGQPLPAVTLAAFLGGALALVLTFIAARNLPGLVELGLLSRIHIDAGTRYAVSSISRYLIVIVGLVIGRAHGRAWFRLAGDFRQLRVRADRAVRTALPGRRHDHHRRGRRHRQPHPHPRHHGGGCRQPRSRGTEQDLHHLALRQLDPQRYRDPAGVPPGSGAGRGAGQGAGDAAGSGQKAPAGAGAAGAGLLVHPDLGRQFRFRTAAFRGRTGPPQPRAQRAEPADRGGTGRT